MNIINNLSNKAKYIALKGKAKYISALGRFGNGPLLNYCIENNAGDSFNEYFVEKYFHTRVRLYNGGKRYHTLFCGSILGKSNEYSNILGAGFISEEQSNKPIRYNKVIGVRGNLTAESLKLHDKDLSIDFKGDPGLLVREIINPRNSNYTKNNKIGVIPHFIDYDIVKRLIAEDPTFILIDIKNTYDIVCYQILSCDVILSSSLHGLIFSDAMNVPNSWVKFSDRVKGGTFKFRDYYSVMTNPQENFFSCKNTEDLLFAAEQANVSVNNNYDLMYLTVMRYFHGSLL